MSFQAYIHSLIEKFSGCLAPTVVTLLKENIEMYKDAFTVGNYEVLEQIGDSIISHFIISYSYKKFPFLNKKDGVKIVARIRINYTSCQYLAAIAQELGFWDYIQGKEDPIPNDSRRSGLLEDVFEAFIGATSEIVDLHIGNGTGYIVCNSILWDIYDGRDISLSYESLFDAKTRLKELCDFYKKRVAPSWAFDKEDNIFVAKLNLHIDGRESLEFRGESRVKIEAEQQASERALATLKAKGIEKDVPEIFRRLGIA